MASLLFVNDLLQSGRTIMYDPNTWYNSHTRSYSLELPNPVYQFELVLHCDQFESDNLFWVKVRQFVNRNLLSDVVVATKDLSYTVKQPYMSISGSRKYASTDVRNLWHRFFFDNEEEHMMFKLALPCRSEMTKLHPDGKHDTYHHLGGTCWSEEPIDLANSTFSTPDTYKFYSDSF